jgi:CcmD family protein
MILADRRLKTLVRRIAACCLLALLALSAPARTAAQPAQPPEQQDQFRPISELPPQDQLPAAPLLIGAYSVVLLALFFYVLSVARRLNSVQREMQRLETDVKRGGRG